jgi:hypothetical protein
LKTILALVVAAILSAGTGALFVSGSLFADRPPPSNDTVSLFTEPEWRAFNFSLGMIFALAAVVLIVYAVRAIRKHRQAPRVRPSGP